MLLDLPGAARRNHSPCLVCSGALGYGKSYAAKRITRAEIQRGTQAFIVDPGTEWQKAALPTSPTKPSSTWPATNSAATRCAPSRPTVAGGYWLDYMVPMMSLDPRSDRGAPAAHHLATPMPASGSASPAPPP